MEETKKKGLKEEAISHEGDIEKDVVEPAYTEVETRIRHLVSKTINDYKLSVFPEIYDIIKAKVLFSGDVRAIYNKLGWENKNCDVYPLIDSTHDTYCANMYDTTISTRAIARNSDDIDKTETAQNLFDWCFSITGAEDVRELIRNEAALIGTSYGMAGFRDIREVKEYKAGLGESSIKRLSMDDVRPTIEHVPFFEMFYPISTYDFYRTQWKVRRKIMSFDEIKSKWGSSIDFEDEEICKTIKNTNTPICTTDFSKIWDIKTFEKQYVQACITNAEPGGVMSDFMYDNLFNVICKENDLYELIEYWERNSLIIMINGRIFYDDVSPYPMGDPFGIVTFEKTSGSCRGRGIGHKLMSHQKQANTYHNKIIDAMNMHIDPMYIIQEGQIVNKAGQSPNKIKWTPGGTIITKDASVNNGGIRPLEFIDFNIIQLAMNDLRACRDQAQEIIGTNSYSQGGQGKIERSFGAVNARLGVVRARLQPLIKSLNVFDTFMFEAWLSVATALMPKEFKVRVLGEDGVKYWEEVSPSDIINRFDFECDSEAGRQATKAERAQTLVNTINTLSPFFTDPVSGLPIVDFKSIVTKGVEQLDFNGVKPMSKEEVIEYLKSNQEIQAAAQPPQQEQPQQGGGEQEAMAAMMTQQQAPVDPNMQQQGEDDYSFMQRTGVTPPLV